MTPSTHLLVPREPTDEMFNAGEVVAKHYCDRWSMSIANDVWEAMIAASPAVAEGEVERVARIIDAKAFLEDYPDVYASRQRAAADYWIEARNEALIKARAILGLTVSVADIAARASGDAAGDAPCQSTGDA